MRGALSNPGAYWLVQRLLGAPQVHRHVVTETAQVRAGERVLDLGCGTGRLLDVMPAVEYVGLDQSQAYIDAARRRYGERGSFRLADVSAGDPPGDEPFDLVLAIGVMHHLDDGAVGGLLALAGESLKPDGRLVTLDPTLVEGQPQLARRLAERDRGTVIRRPTRYLDLAAERFDSVVIEVRHDLARVPYSHAILRCEGPRGT